jgi:hypothetical protein
MEDHHSPSPPAQLLTNGTGITLDEHCQKAWKWWRESLKSPKRVLAPMVDQSELTYRMLSREYGADLCYSPMIHARLYAEADETQRSYMFSTVPEDRPLVVQFCGNDPQVLLKAALAIQVTQITSIKTMCNFSGTAKKKKNSLAHFVLSVLVLLLVLFFKHKCDAIDLNLGKQIYQ